MNRCALIRTPSRIAFAGASFFTKDAQEVKINQDTIEIKTDAHGKVDERVIDVMAVATGTPEGRWSAAIIAALWPYSNTTVGTDVYNLVGGTDTDTPCEFHCSDSSLVTLIAAAITKMPSLKFSSKESLVGQVEITGVRGNDMAWDDADSLISVAATGGDIADATFAPALIKTQPYTGVLTGVSGFDTGFDTEDGFEFVPEVKLQDGETNNVGKITKHFVEASALVKCKPVGPTIDQILAAAYVQDTGASRGQSLAAVGVELVITGGDGIDYLTIPNAAIKGPGFRFGALTLQNGEIGFVASRTYSAGVQQPLWTLAAS
jgi:hypothetical protein